MESHFKKGITTPRKIVTLIESIAGPKWWKIRYFKKLFTRTTSRITKNTLPYGPDIIAMTASIKYTIKIQASEY